MKKGTPERTDQEDTRELSTDREEDQGDGWPDQVRAGPAIYACVQELWADLHDALLLVRCEDCHRLLQLRENGARTRLRGRMRIQGDCQGDRRRGEACLEERVRRAMGCPRHPLRGDREGDSRLGEGQRLDMRKCLELSAPPARKVRALPR